RRELGRRMREPRVQERDGLRVHYVPFVSPPRARSYGHWGAWAALPLAATLRRIRRRFRFDVLHAHNGIPTGDAVRRSRLSVPLIISVHGPDVLWVPEHIVGGEGAVRRAFAAARMTLANSSGIAALARRQGAPDVRVVHLGTDLPGETIKRRETLVTVGH